MEIKNKGTVSAGVYFLIIQLIDFLALSSRPADTSQGGEAVVALVAQYCATESSGPALSSSNCCSPPPAGPTPLESSLLLLDSDCEWDILGKAMQEAFGGDGGG